MLLVDDRVVLRATAPPDAEYALFDASEIELRASEPGRVREHSYQTTVAIARSRLEQIGATPALARECGLAMQPTLSSAYARGSAVQRLATYLGPLELFQSSLFDAATQTYRGVFLDLPTLAFDLGLPAAGVALQLLYLATLLENERSEATVILSTEGWTKQSKPGQRTYKRPNVATLRDLERAISELVRFDPKPLIVENLPRADVIAFIRSRIDGAPDDDTRALYTSLERSVSVRERPERGPLSDPELWSVETALDAGAYDNVVAVLDRIEEERGRTPGTTYLRARASLAMRLEPPRLVAERVSALALSMTNFQELSLLAAEAWLEAGDPRRAVPYARDLVDAPGIDEGLLLRAQRILARAVGAAPDRRKTLADTLASAMPPSQLPPPLVAPPAPQPISEFDFALDLPPIPPLATAPPDPAPAVPAAARPPSIELEMPPLEAAFTFDLPAPETLPTPEQIASPRSTSAPRMPASRPPSGSSPPSQRPSRRLTGVMRELRESRIPAALDPRAEPDSDSAIPVSASRPPLGSAPRPPLVSRPTPKSPPPRPPSQKPKVASYLPPAFEDDHVRPTPLRPVSRSSFDSFTDESLPPSFRPPATTPLLEADLPPEASSESNIRVRMYGASLPPYKHEAPAPLIARAPLLPKIGGPDDELAEHLALPAGLAPDATLRSVLPKSVLEARVQFTMLSRQLGMEYRERRGIELRADVSGIEAMQAVLLESFPDHTLHTARDVEVLKRHGAFLSEILIRRLDAEWVDISPNELGYWSLIVPPDTRVWPFGRLARFVQMGHRERDLVSYFFELSSRIRGR
ncbi:Basic proline-rich protein precursor [Labilithrix luteola]|uniref:Basic proline-rich protein n=2 Tax=Labilithrix luteola TaxID=1391654 RepID=A0A0K1QCR5_9BACT|nr:Basic proline-rich protein precursor [Labilithrix luteola]